MNNTSILLNELELAKVSFANGLDIEIHALVKHYKEAKVMAQRAAAQIQVAFNNSQVSTYVQLRDMDLTFMCKARFVVDILDADPDFMVNLALAEELQAALDAAQTRYDDASRAEHEAAQARLDAIAAATAAAIAKVEADFAVPEEPTAEPEIAPFRGKGLRLASA